MQSMRWSSVRDELLLTPFPLRCSERMGGSDCLQLSNRNIFIKDGFLFTVSENYLALRKVFVRETARPQTCLLSQLAKLSGRCLGCRRKGATPILP